MKHYLCRVGTFCIGVMGKIVDLITDIKFLFITTYKEWTYEIKLISAEWTLAGLFEHIKLLAGGILAAYSVSLIKLDKHTKFRKRHREDMYTSSLYVDMFDWARVWNYIHLRI